MLHSWILARRKFVTRTNTERERLREREREWKRERARERERKREIESKRGTQIQLFCLVLTSSNQLRNSTLKKQTVLLYVPCSSLQLKHLIWHLVMNWPLFLSLSLRLSFYIPSSLSHTHTSTKRAYAACRTQHQDQHSCGRELIVL